MPFFSPIYPIKKVKQNKLLEYVGSKVFLFMMPTCYKKIIVFFSFSELKRIGQKN